MIKAGACRAAGGFRKLGSPKRRSFPSQLSYIRSGWALAREGAGCARAAGLIGKAFKYAHREYPRDSCHRSEKRNLFESILSPKLGKRKCNRLAPFVVSASYCQCFPGSGQGFKAQSLYTGRDGDRAHSAPSRAICATRDCWIDNS